MIREPTFQIILVPRIGKSGPANRCVVWTSQTLPPNKSRRNATRTRMTRRRENRTSRRESSRTWPKNSWRTPIPQAGLFSRAFASSSSSSYLSRRRYNNNYYYYRYYYFTAISSDTRVVVNRSYGNSRDRISVPL